MTACGVVMEYGQRLSAGMRSYLNIPDGVVKRSNNPNRNKRSVTQRQKLYKRFRRASMETTRTFTIEAQRRGSPNETELEGYSQSDFLFERNGVIY